MYLTSPEFYTKSPTFIPNAIPGAVGVKRNDDLLSIIDKYEGELLYAILGPDQFRVFKRVAGFVINDWWGYTRITGNSGQLLTDEAGRFLVIPNQRVEHSAYSYNNGNVTIQFEDWNELLFGDGLRFSGLQKACQLFVFVSWLNDSEMTRHFGTGKLQSNDLSQGVSNREHTDRWNDLIDTIRAAKRFMQDSPKWDASYINQFDTEYLNEFF